MREPQYISHENLRRALDAMIARYAVFAPQRAERSIEFLPLESGSAVIRLAYPSSKWAPKRFLFPQCESLLKCNFAAQGRDRLSPVEIPTDRPVLLYGVRPCDAHSFAILDHVFLKQAGVVDPYYATRRENTTVIAIACDQPASTCFCVSLEGGPHDSQGADALLREVEESGESGESSAGYLVEILTEKGARAFEGLALEAASAGQIAQAGRRKAAAEATARIDVQPRDLTAALGDIFESDVWDRIHDKCLGCGTCTFLCPTCHCFDIQDERAGADGRRLRNWDSCMFPLFALHASGHNPRGSQRERWRQRAMHKFNYYPTKFGPIACVGCGRCVKDCPTGIDIRRILKTLETAAARAE